MCDKSGKSGPGMSDILGNGRRGAKHRENGRKTKSQKFERRKRKWLRKWGKENARYENRQEDKDKENQKQKSHTRDYGLSRKHLQDEQDSELKVFGPRM